MSLKKKIQTDLKEAMKAGETEKRDTLRMLDSMIKNTEIEKKKRDEGLFDEEIIEIVSRAVKQRRDSVEQYQKGGRDDLSEKESREIKILSVYLPKQLDEEEIRKIVDEAIKKTGAQSKSDMGKVMGMVMVELKGKADGNLVKKIVEERL